MAVLASLLFILALLRCSDCLREASIDMGGATTAAADEYLCTAVPVADLAIEDGNDAQFVGVAAVFPNVSDNVHHVKVVVCVEPGVKDSQYWSCNDMLRDEPGHVGMCKQQLHHGYEQTPLYSWSADGDPIMLPEGAAFLVDKSHFVVMQTHYPEVQTEPDYTGMTLMLMDEDEMSTVHPAGMLFNMYYNMVAAEFLPPRSTTVLEVLCDVPSGAEWLLLKGMPHTHSLGKSVCFYKIDKGTEKYSLLSRLDPQLPQSYYPLSEVTTASVGDQLAVRCVLDNPGDEAVQLGFGMQNEMCGFVPVYVDYGPGAGSYDELILGTCSDRHIASWPRDGVVFDERLVADGGCS